MALSSFRTGTIEVLSGGEFVIKKRYGFNSAKIIFQRDVFVRRVSIFVRQAKTQKHARNLKGVVHLRHKRNGTAFANEYSFLTESGFERVDRFLKNWMGIRRYPWLAGTEKLKAAMHCFRQQFSNMFFNKL